MGKIFNPITNQYIDEYGLTAKKLYKLLIDSYGIESEFILPPLLTYQNGRFKKLKPAVNFTNVRRITYDQVFTQANQLVFMRDVFSQYAGQKIQIGVKYTLTDDNGDAVIIEKDEIIEIPPLKKGFSKWWKSFTQPGGSIIVIDS